MRAFTIRPSSNGHVAIEAGIRLEAGQFPLDGMQPTPDLLARLGGDGLVDSTTPYRRLDPTAEVIDLGPEVLPDVRALILLDGRASDNGAFFAFVHHSDKEAGVEVLLRTNARAGTGRRAQMIELVVLLPNAGVPILLGGEHAETIVRWDGERLLTEEAPVGVSRAARPSDVLVPV
jgi:hypothetical protein